MATEKKPHKIKNETKTIDNNRLLYLTKNI